MTFSDIFKSSFLESVTEFSPLDVLLGMVVALIVGLFIFVIYKRTFTGVMYSTGFDTRQRCGSAEYTHVCQFYH